MKHPCVPGGVQTLGFFVFDILDGLLKRCDERHRVSQVALPQLEFGNQHTVFVDYDQPVSLFHVHSFCAPVRRQLVGVRTPQARVGSALGEYAVAVDETTRDAALSVTLM